jgi:hypothetical protein
MWFLRYNPGQITDAALPLKQAVIKNKTRKTSGLFAKIFGV